MIKQSVLLSNKIYAKILVLNWKLLLSFVLLSSFLNELIRAAFNFESTLSLSHKLSILISETLISAILLMTIPFLINNLTKNKSETDLPENIKRHFLPLLIETIRMYTVLLLWLLLLVMPMVFKYARYHLYPFVIYFDKDYQSGELDALKRSSELVKGHTLFILFVLLIEALFIYLLKSVSEQFSGYQYTFINFTFTLFTVLGSVYTFCIYYNLFSLKLNRFKLSNQTIEGEKNESNF